MEPYLSKFIGRIKELGTSKSCRWSYYRGGRINLVTLLGNALDFAGQ